MDHGHGLIFGPTWIVTTPACGCRADYVAKSPMVDIAVYGQVLVRMTIQAVGRVSGRGDGVDDLLPRTVVAGGAGTVAVGGHVVLGPFDLGPARHCMASATKLPR